MNSKKSLLIKLKMANGRMANDEMNKNKYLSRQS